MSYHPHPAFAAVTDQPLHGALKTLAALHDESVDKPNDGRSIATICNLSRKVYEGSLDVRNAQSGVAAALARADALQAAIARIEQQRMAK